MGSGSGSYKIRSTDPEDLAVELDRLFTLIGARLDEIQGLVGVPKFYNTIKTSYDVVVLSSSRGLILKEDVNPPHYWRVSIVAGVLTATDLGTTYE